MSLLDPPASPTPTATSTATTEPRLAEERARLVRFCAHLSGSAEAADELAQETLIEAWRHADRLRDPAARERWLAGIARNVCRRWARRRAREAARAAPLERAEGLRGGDLGWPGGNGSVELDVERDELVALLDRALAVLPPPARDVLTQRYVDERPHAEIAARLGVGDGAVMVRVHRAKQALRRALARPELRDEAASFGILPADPGEQGRWRETRIWCPFCGRRRLSVLAPADAGTRFRCPGECVPDGTIVDGKPANPAGRTLTSAKSILSRELLGLDRRYRQAVADGRMACIRCGRDVALRRWRRHDLPVASGSGRGIGLPCADCRAHDTASLSHLALDAADVQRFWRRQPRIRVLPVREIDFAGRAALLTGFANLGGEARIEVVFSADTYEVLSIEDAAR